MSPRGEPRWNHAYRLWKEWLGPAGHPQLDRWLAREVRGRAYGKRDRLWYGDVLFAAARFVELAGFMGAAQGPDEDWDALLEAYLAAAEPSRPAADLPSFFRWIWLRALSERIRAERGDSRIQREIFASCRAWVSTGPLEAGLLWHGYPLRWRDVLLERARRSGWGREELRTFVEAQASRPPLWLRAARSVGHEALHDELSVEYPDLQTRGQAFGIPPGVATGSLAAVREGRALVQDLASQALTQLLDAAPGERLWDVCAGAGGKALYLADQVGEQGEVVATDRRDWALRELDRRARQAGLGNLRTALWQGGKLSGAAPAFFPAVLVDAPCTGSGTWRRHPDGRFRTQPGDLADHQSRQLQLLGAAAAAVARGGRLVYGTCSLAVAENEAVVEALLAQEQDFELEKALVLGCPAADADTLFGALLRRRLA